MCFEKEASKAATRVENMEDIEAISKEKASRTIVIFNAGEEAFEAASRKKTSQVA